MNRDTAVSIWREVCGSDTVMAMGMATGRMLEEFARRIEADERERCAKLIEPKNDPTDWTECSHHAALLARRIRLQA